MKTYTASKEGYSSKRDNNGIVPRAGEDPYALSKELSERLASIPRAVSRIKQKK
jgi:hypothetical protein